MDPGAALWAGAGGIIIFIAALPLWGRLSDRIGRKPVLAISLLGTAALYFPMQRLMSDQPWTLFVATASVLVFLAGTMAILPAVFAESSRPTHIRTVGTAVPYSIAVALFGGTAPYLQTWFGAQLELPWLFSLYSVILLLISAATAIFLLPETKGRELLAPSAPLAAGVGRTFRVLAHLGGPVGARRSPQRRRFWRNKEIFAPRSRDLAGSLSRWARPSAAAAGSRE